ncbi:short-chain dehydrogenase/reductase [Niastella koreensis]|uniref:3-oxoacyl-(Acyl-carrier-protein) reductase n=2 Tax=Niastella koreensis TaxID=354356 RepID=G8TJ68_NIAKG|nr:SDR family oxidoreductase [Niastella koreensis]AEV98601.1 3-oxoacyl-(acyl-carrier-protein) reductase [Niastella koreensis GR20-10]OQP53323.1 short-chain dehydrogenase/reductase [Niastella koreensis]
MKTIFITGAGAGLGKATAKLFQSKGWQVIATMRNPERETELQLLENVTVLQLDVTDASQIDNTVKQVIEKYGVDVVLNNAGYGLIGPLEAFSDVQITRQIDTNLLGVIRVMKAFTPYLRSKGEGVFITISSMFGLAGFPTCSLYSATKWALEGFCECMAYDLATFGVRVKTIAPGGIQTDFAGRSLDGAGHNAYMPLMAKVSEGYNEEALSKYSTAQQIADVIYEAATDNNNQLRYLAGPDAVALYKERLELGPEAHFQKTRQWVVGR